MQSHDAEYRESGEGWARTPKPAAMTAPLSDTRLDMHRRLSALSRKPYGDMEAALADLLAEVDRLRAQRAGVVELHDWDELVFGGFYCMHCTMDDSLGEPVSWPCPTLRAVGMTDEEALAIITAHRVSIAEGAGQ